MQSTDVPDFFYKIFGISGGVTYVTQPIPTNTQVSIDPGRASMETGFPPDTFKPLQSGGIPPDGRDMNGVLYMSTAWDQWQAAGGPTIYDAAFAAAIGGYPKGARLSSTDYLHEWISTADNNSTDPDAGGANWTSARQANALAGATRNLAGVSAGAVKTATWTADQLVAATALAGTTYLGTSLTLAFNGAGTGANGMDTGSTPVSNNFYIYGIFNPTTGTWATLGTIAGAGATIYAGVNMPAGFVASCLIGAFITNASGQFQQFQQYDRDIYITSSNVVLNGTNTTPTGVGITTVVPACAKAVWGNCSMGASAGTGYLGGTAGSGAGGAGMVGFQWCSASIVGNFGPIPLPTSQLLYYYVSTGGATMSIALDGYKI